MRRFAHADEASLVEIALGALASEAEREFQRRLDPRFSLVSSKVLGESNLRVGAKRKHRPPQISVTASRVSAPASMIARDSSKSCKIGDGPAHRRRLRGYESYSLKRTAAG